MGNLIKNLAEISFRDNSAKNLSIEINAGDSEPIIHIQSPSWRMELTEAEFREFASSIVEAERKIKSYKRFA